MTSRGLRDHPRGCGEKGTLAKKKVEIEGSSPRVRGEAGFVLSGLDEGGIIPAGAGRSPIRYFRGVICGDHPRGCGEKNITPPRPPLWRGSSPRVRGEGGGWRRRATMLGIIPAGAGRRLPGVRARRFRGDHPRGCGEKWLRGPRGRRCRGSSPRVRGEVCEGLGIRLLEGDHPRGCGEKVRAASNEAANKGSSPRVRGEGGEGTDGAVERGIIPAGAGRSDDSRPRQVARRDHPRGCGEKRPRPCRRRPSAGSSPRVRGEVRSC